MLTQPRTNKHNPHRAHKRKSVGGRHWTFSDLFCGIGGFHYAAASLGLRCVYACDIDKYACSQYEHNFGIIPDGDITQVKAQDIPDHDLLFGGFPCQPFSIIGKKQGFQDSRGVLIYDVARVLACKQPKAFVLENVRQLATNNNGDTLQVILNVLSRAGYKTTWRVLNALNYGLPQKRERLIIVGFRKQSILSSFEFPHPKRSYIPLSSILEAQPPSRYYASPRIQARRKAAHTAAISPSIWHENKSGNISSHPYSCALRAGASYNYLLVDGERRLTPREQLRLQGFPDSFEIIGSDSQLRKQAGNAVPVPMVHAVINKVLHAILSQNPQRISETRNISSKSVPC